MTTCNLGKNLDFIREVKSILEKVKDSSDGVKTYIEELLRLKDKFDIKESLEEHLTTVYSVRDVRKLFSKDETLKGILFSGDKVNTYAQELSTLDYALVESTLDLGSKFDNIDSTDSEKNSRNAAKEHFLNPFFPMASGSRLYFELDFKHELIKNLFFNSKTGRLNKNGIEIDLSIKDLRKTFETELDEYIRLTQPDYFPYYQNKSLSGKISYFKELLEEGILFNISSTEILRIPVLNQMLNKITKAKLKAYTAYISLTYFDDLIENALGDSVRVMYKNNYFTKELKYSVNLGDRNVVSWSDESLDIDETELIGGIIRLYMESLDLYDPKSGEKLPFKMTFNDVKSGVVGIMKFLELAVVNGQDSGMRTRVIIEGRAEDENNIKELLRDLIGSYYKEGFEDIWDEYFQGKTLPLVIAATKRKPNLLAPALFAYLVADKSIDFGRYLEYQGVYSIFKNIFDYNNKYSLLRKVDESGGINLDSADIYSFVTTLFVNLENIRMLEYKRDSDGSLSIINIIQNTENVRLNSLKYQLEGMYNVTIPQNFKTFTFLNFEGRLLKINLNNSNYELRVNVNDDGTPSVNFLSNGTYVTPDNRNSIVLEFLSEVFGKDINSEFMDMFELNKGNISELLDIAGVVLYNYKVGKEVQKYIKENPSKKLKELYDIKVKEFYPKNPPSTIRGQMLPELTNSTLYVKMLRLVKTLDFLQGYSGETTAKDGLRKQISLVALSSLMSKYMEIVYNHNFEDEDSILKKENFSIYDFFEGVEFVRAYSGSDSKKTGTSFSENEFFAANFIYDFYGQLFSETENGRSTDLNLTSKKPTKLRIMGPVVADKPRIPKIVVDWLSNTRVKDEDGNIKKLYELTPEDIYKILNKEFGQYYKGVYQRIHQDLDILNPIIANLNLSSYSVVFAHPALGKTWSVTNGKMLDKIIDWDTRFNIRRDEAIAQHEGLRLEDPTFKAIREDYLINPESHKWYIDFMDLVWEEVKAEAKRDNKILVVSPHVLLKRHAKDFNVVINIDEKTFVDRNVRRKANTRKNSRLWKQNIDNTIADLIKEGKINEYDVFTTDRFLENILFDSELDYDNDFESFNLYAKVRGLSPDEIIHNAIYELLKLSRERGESDYLVRITENIHFVRGGDKQIHNSASLFHLLSIYDLAVPYKVRKNKKYLPNIDLTTIDETSEMSRRRINLLLISELIQGDTIIKLGITDSNVIDGGRYAAEAHNKSWSKGRMIVYGRIKGANVDLYSEDSFRLWEDYRHVLSLLKHASEVSPDNKELKKLVESIDVKSPKFNLGKALEIVNKYNKYSQLLEYDKESKSRKIRDIIAKNVTLPKEEVLRPIVESFFRTNNPTWGEEAILRNVEKVLNNKDRSKQIYTSHLIFSYVADTFSNSAQALAAYDVLEEYVTDNSIQSKEFDIEINPEIERYLALNNWIYESYMLTSAGSFIAHPGNNKATTILNYEYGHFGLQVKRNVSQTATKHREVQDSLKGIRNRIRMALVEDEKDSSITFKGDYDPTGIKVHDGGTWYNGTMNQLSNNSLGADAMGLDKKPFIHFIDVRTGLGGIVKTAGFVVTNSHILESARHKRMNKIMNDTIKWTDSLRKFGYTDTYFDWLTDFRDNKLGFSNGWYVYKDGNYYRYYNPRIDENGNTIVSVLKVRANGEIFNEQPFEITFGYVGNIFTEIRKSDETGKYYDFNGNLIIGEVELKPINSNWELWKVFGGEYSAHKENGTLTYFNDNSSFLNVNYVMNHTGKVINSRLPVHSQSNVVQILKESQIDMIPTMGAVKFGATNINTVRMFDDDNYKVTYMEVFSDDLGELLNAEHLAEGGHVSLMTLVINAIGARGYSRDEAEECYEALELLALQSFESAFDGLNEVNKGEVTEKLKLEIANILLNSLKNTSLLDGDILSAIAVGINKMLKFTTYSDIEKRFPISSPLIFNNLFSKLASSLEKAAIRLKFDGGMLVLNPSNRIFRIINGKLEGRVSLEELLNLQNNSFLHPTLNGSDIKMGHNYFIMGDPKAKLVDKLEDFYYILKAVEEGKIVCEAFVENYSTITDKYGTHPAWNLNKPLGRDLATYDLTVSVEDKNENGEKILRNFSVWLFDIVRQLHSWNKKTNRFNIKENVPLTRLEILWNLYMDTRKANSEALPSLELINELLRIGITEVNPNRMHKQLEAYLQETLNSVGSGIGRTVIIDGQEFVINKVNVSPYEAIMPMIYKTTFGLKEGDSIGEIENDLYFFVKRLIENSKSKFGFEDEEGNFVVNGSVFDLELKRTSGEHIYLAHPSRKKPRNPEIVELETEVVGEVLYRLHPVTKKRMYQIPSKEENGIIVPNCEIIKSSNGTEIMYTNDFNTILDLMEYNSVAFGDLSSLKLEDLKNIFLQLEQSTNNSAKAKAQYVINAVNEKALRTKKGLEEHNALYTIVAKDVQLTNDFLNYTPRNSISEIFQYLDNPKDAAISTLTHHELYRNDATNLYRELRELEGYITGERQAEDEDGNPMDFMEWYSQTKPYIKHILDFGIKQHTSFLATLESIVSRTPALSLQSFMAMKVAGFDVNETNSIYVNRMQLFLQGSDYDIDKANVLGVKINNGILLTWSPYFDLHTKEREELSEMLPFPAGKELKIEAFPAKIAFDFLEKDYKRYTDERGQSIVDNDGNGVVVRETADGVFIETLDNNTNNYLVQHAAFLKLEQGKTKVFGNFNKDVFLVDENDVFIGINRQADLRFFVDSYNLNTNDITLYYKNLRNVLKSFTKIGSIIPELQNIKRIVDKHNTFFLDKNGKSNKRLDRKKREALYNFVSIKVKNISKNPINLIQGQSGIDVATDSVKDLVKPGGRFDRLSTTPESSDSRTPYARMRLLVLTLTGKDDVGIVASAMKVFEALSHYYYKVLAEGTLEELERLLSNISVLGKKLKLIANSYVKNEDSIKSNKVLEAYRNVDNTQDAFIMMSALLSLATDNTKDPTLSKLNASPGTIGCYTAGLVLGLSIEEVADLLISDTGIMLANMTKGNVFNSDVKLFSKLTLAIRYLLYPPKYPGTVDLSSLFESFGLWKKTKEHPNITATAIEDIIKKKRKRIRELAKYVLDKNGKLETDIRKLAEREVKNITDDSDYYGWLKRHADRLLELSKNNNRDKKELSEYENLQEKYKKYLELKQNLEAYQKYLDSPSQAPLRVKEELENMSKINKELQNEKSNLNQTIFNMDLGVKEFFRDIFDWTSRREIIENDFVEINGVKYNRFRQIRKLNSFNDEMGDLRKVLKLNQGLPNAVKDLLSWINQFSGILSRAANRTNRKSKDDNALGRFAALNNDTLNLDLNRFLNNMEYQKAAIEAYEEAKIGVNILAVMANSSHYRGYMKTMNLLYEGGKAVSLNYKSLAWISKNILPLLRLNTVELNDEFFKKVTPVTFNRINLMFLWLQQVLYNIPKFEIVDGELYETRDENGKLQYETIRLGTEATNQKFKDYIVNYVYPYLLNNYSNNAFVKAIGLRSYSYNLDHKISINLAKTLLYNMNNPTDKVRFNEVKKGLSELAGLKGTIPALFYYNLIAYNGQPGQLSLTNLFEDFMVYGSNKTINDYNAFITYLDESDINIWTENNTDYLLKVLAPEIYSITELVGTKIPYAWIVNPENNLYRLIKYKEKTKNKKKRKRPNDLEEEEDPYDVLGDSGYNPFEDEEGINDNEELGIFKKHATYKSWGDVMEKGMGEYTDNTGLEENEVSNREFILGSVVIDSESFTTLSPDKRLSELTYDEKLKLLKSNKDNVKIKVNGTDLTLLGILDMARNNGWTEEAIYDSFLFYKRKSRSEVYDYFDIDLLKSRLDILINLNKEKNCNG